MKHYALRNKKSFFFNLSVTLQILIVTSLISIILFFFSKTYFLDYFALKPSNLFQGKYVWTLLTSIFVHASLFHLVANMFSLFFVGKLLERIVGRKRFFWFYILSGIFAGLFFAIVSFFFGNSAIGARIFSSPEISAVGASGAIFGILGVLVVLIPRKKVFLIAGPLVAIILQAILGFFVNSQNILGLLNIIVSIYIFLCLFSMFSFRGVSKFALPVEMSFWVLPILAIIPLVLIDFFFPLPIGNFAHLGGLIFGLIYGLYLNNRYKNKIKFVRDYFHEN